jgi:hypothetical protein
MWHLSVWSVAYVCHCAGSLADSLADSEPAAFLGHRKRSYLGEACTTYRSASPTGISRRLKRCRFLVAT